MTKPRTCTCCSDSLPTSAFTHNPKLGTYTPACRSCGVWLYLFRQVFGKSRYMDRVRESQREYYKRKKIQRANVLFVAWGIRRAA